MHDTTTTTVRPAALLRRWASAAGLLVATALPPLQAGAATATQSANFSFTHTGSVSTGLVSLGGVFSNPTSTTPADLLLQRFDPTLGKLTGVTLAVTTTTSSFAVTNTGLLSLASQASATRTLGYGVTAGTLTASDSNSVTSTSAALLTALSTASTPIGGAPLTSTLNYSAAADLAQFTGSGTLAVRLTATNVLGVTAGVSALNGAGFSGTGTYAGSVLVTYTYVPAVTVSGSVYRDANHNGLKDSTETGTGLTLYAKLVAASSPAGPALRAVAVNTSTGLWTMAAVIPGDYTLLIDDNSTLADVTPLLPPAGWTAVEQGTLQRSLPGLAIDLAQQNFGLAPFVTLAGRLFNDNGAGGGTANDGVLNGSEAGVGGAVMRLLDVNSTVLDNTVSSGNGSWRLFVPASVANGVSLRVVPTLAPQALATGATLGSSGGSFSRIDSSITLAHATGVSRAGLDAGSVPPPRLLGNLQRTGLPGAVVFHQQRFVAGTAGQVTVTFALADPAATQVAGWNDEIYLDANNNGVVDASEQPVAGAIAVVAGQVLSLITKVQIPANAPFGARHQGSLRAAFVFSNAAPALSQTATALLITDVSSTDAASLSLVKSVDKQSARPGDSVVYALSFTNLGSTALANVIISDATPAYTRFVSAAVTLAPADLGTATAVLPQAGQAGVLQWTFPGQLAPGETGIVTFTVVLE